VQTRFDILTKQVRSVELCINTGEISHRDQQFDYADLGRVSTYRMIEQALLFIEQ